MLAIVTLGVAGCGSDDPAQVNERPAAVSEPIWDTWRELGPDTRADTCEGFKGDEAETALIDVAAAFDLTELEAVVFLTEVCGD